MSLDIEANGRSVVFIKKERDSNIYPVYPTDVRQTAPYPEVKEFIMPNGHSPVDAWFTSSEGGISGYDLTTNLGVKQFVAVTEYSELVKIAEKITGQIGLAIICH